ncbi:MAG: nitroreductase [bacterium]
MSITEAILNRKSIRGFKKNLVSKDMLQEILDVATRAPSATNSQPWEITVVSGTPLENIRHDNLRILKQGDKSIRHDNFTSIYRERQIKLAKQIFNLMGIKREDKEKRKEWQRRGFRFFDAPAAIIISMDGSLKGNQWSLFDIGLLTQNICLVALNYQLGTCIEAQGVSFPEVIKKHAKIADNKEIVIGIAIGYPDWNFPANSLRSEREKLENITAWISD